MKKLKATLTLSVAGILFFSNNCLAATTNATSSTAGTTSVTKYIAIGVAAVIIILLLFLGYKMDSKGSDTSITSKKGKSKKKVKQNKKEDAKYEPDSVTYKADDVNNSDLSEPVEYEEDTEENNEEESSLFSAMNDETDNYDDNTFLDENSESTDSAEEYGEDFDTSILDNIDDEEELEAPKNNMDETMVFNNPPALETEEPADTEEPEEKVEDVDPIMEELSHIDKTESNFGGFSVGEKKAEEKKEEKPRKKYTKVKKDSISTDNFLEQMEENLKKDKEERDARKGKK